MTAEGVFSFYFIFYFLFFFWLRQGAGKKVDVADGGCDEVGRLGLYPV
jgi:hypothetical protein